MVRLATTALYLVFVFFLASCERPLDIDLAVPDAKLVVVSNFTNDQQIQVYVSRSRSILQEDPEAYVLDAQVDLYREDEFITTLQLVHPGDSKLPPYYTTDELIPQIGVNYALKVAAPGFESVMANSQIPAQVNINSIEIYDLHITIDETTGNILYNFNVSLQFDDPIAEVNYYHLKFFQQISEFVLHEGDTVVTDIYRRSLSFSPLNDNNVVNAYFGGGILLEDDPFGGDYSFSLSIPIRPQRELLGKLFVELRTLSREYYLFHNSLNRQQESDGNTIGGEVTIFNNVENGHGNFSGYSNAVDSMHVVF